MSSTTAGNRDFKLLAQHPEYYLKDGNLHLLAENTLFRVHSYFFTRESTRFKETLENTVSPGQDRKGTSDSNALVLDNITADEFAKFLWIFYDPIYSHTSTVEHWTTILDLAHRWVFPNVKEMALKSLEALAIPLVNRIALYQKYDAPERILNPHYGAICARPEMPTLEETTILGGPTSIMIFSVRERILSGQNNVRFGEIDARTFQQSVSSYFSAQKKKNEAPKESTTSDKAKPDARANGHLKKDEKAKGAGQR